jgi:ribosome-associated toxin RatA of RatAB toxin-antitoxin module
MALVKKTALVGYSPKQMFELVNLIEDYPLFLPWCRESHIITQQEHQVEASLDIAWAGMHKSFTTRNVLYPFHKIEIQLINGPFKHLHGNWVFTAMGSHGCKVELDLEFEFAGHFLDTLFQSIFHKMANELVDLFCKRAADIYGTH